MNDKVIVRVKFKKIGVMKFIGHLDTMRYFQKAIRRAEIPAAYSQGFHPHMQISFALPLGVGVTTEGDYFDLELDILRDKVDKIAICKALNAEMAAGTDILDVTLLAPKSKKAMAAVCAAKYLLTFIDSVEKYVSNVVDYFNSNDTLFITKKTKKSERTIDLKPLVYDFSAINNNQLEVTLSAGSVNNIKPQLLLEAMPYEYKGIQIHRIDLFTLNEKNMIVPLNNR